MLADAGRSATLPAAEVEPPGMDQAERSRAVRKARPTQLLRLEHGPSSSRSKDDCLPDKARCKPKAAAHLQATQFAMELRGVRLSYSDAQEDLQRTANKHGLGYMHKLAWG